MGEMTGVQRTVEQSVDRPAALVGTLIFEERPDLSHRRDSTSQINGDAAQKLGIVGERSRLHLGRLPAGCQMFFDLCGRLGHILGRNVRLWRVSWGGRQ